MSKRRIIENENIEIDLASWPIVLVDNLSSDEQRIFYSRKKAVDMYLKNSSHNEIESETGIHRNNVAKFIKRCLETDENGVMWGYRALIPHKRITTYTTKNLPVSTSSNPKPNKNGAFHLLLETYPHLRDEIHKQYFKKNGRSASDPVMKIKYIHKNFIDKCREIGLKAPYDYPFNTLNLAKTSLYNYIKKIEAHHMEKASERYGEDAALLAKTTGQGGQSSPPIIKPFQRVQFDGHRIDTSIALVLYTPEGDEIVTVIERIWLLAIIDVGSRAVLGYHVSFNKEYTSSDVLHCIRNSVIPWTPKKFTIPGLRYSENAGFPSGMIPETNWAVWDEFLYDNAKANVSQIVKDRLKQVVKCRVNPGRIKTPIKRSHIERLFGLLEENGFHRLPTTTGSNPKDPRRQNPEEKAVKFRVTVKHIEELVEILIAEYNGTPHEGINFATPLEAISNRIKDSYTLKQLPEEERSEAAFLSLKTTREIQGDIRIGRRPYIQYENVRYTNEVLSRSPGLIGKKIDIFVNIDDLRLVRAFLPDGSELGKLVGMGKWGITPHTLQVRREIYRLKRLKLLHFLSSDDPVKIYQKLLEDGLKTRKRNGNKIHELMRNQERNPKVVHEEEISTYQQNEPINTSEISKKQNNSRELRHETQHSDRKLRKTFIY